MASNRAYMFKSIQMLCYEYARSSYQKTRVHLKPKNEDEPDSDPMIDMRHEFIDWVERKDELDLFLECVAECCESLGANPTVRKILDPGSEVFFLEVKPRDIGPLLGMNPRSVSNCLVWIRKNLYPCIRERFLKRTETMPSA
jgi:hypothetical protein